MIYLVTGAAGHLGRAVVKQLIDDNHEVRALVLPDETNPPENVELFFGDVRDKESLRDCFENSDEQLLIVIHCAGIVSIASRVNQDIYDVNVGGTQNIIDLCMEYDVFKLIYVSSVHAIPEQPFGNIITETKDFNPDVVVGAYAKTKAEATSNVLKATKNGLNACVVHPTGITGPLDYGNGHITTLIIDYYKRRLISGIKGGYDFVDVRDVAKGILSASEKGKNGESYILSNQYYKISEILNKLHELTGKKKVAHNFPIWFLKMSAPLAEWYYKLLNQPPLFTSYSIYTLKSNAHFSKAKAEAELGYTTRDIKVTLIDTINWLKEIKRI